MEYVGLVALGLAVGCLGTLIGAGGGFILVPLLLLIYPKFGPEQVTSISLAVVFFNALSGSVGYARMKRIDYRAGLLFAGAALPGAILGVIVGEYLPRKAFEGILAVALVLASALLLITGGGRALARAEKKAHGNADRSITEGGLPEAGVRPPHQTYNRPLGAVISFFVGWISSLLGIGGGIVHVPILVLVLGFPVHVATATSHFVLAITAGAATTVHVFHGDFAGVLGLTGALAVGVVIGAQFGARLARRAPPVFILRALAAALGVVGLRILYKAVMGG